MGTPHVSRVRPLAGVEGGRITILGENLCDEVRGLPTPQLEGTESRPLISSPGRIVAPIPEGATSGIIRLVWPDLIVDGPVFEVAEKLAGELHPVANPVVDPNGYIFSTFSGSRGQAAPGGVSVFRISPEGGADPFLSDLVNPTGLALDPGGILYISCRNDGTIRKVTPSGQAEMFIDGMGIPTGIAFDREGTLFVGDRSGGVFAVSVDGARRRFARLPASVAAYHLAFGPDGDLYVTAPTLSNDDPIFRINPKGKITTFFKHLARPQGLAFDREGNFFVVAIFQGERGIFQVGDNGKATLAVAGENLVGLTFDYGGRMIIASTNAVYRLSGAEIRGQG